MLFRFYIQGVSEKISLSYCKWWSMHIEASWLEFISKIIDCSWNDAEQDYEFGKKNCVYTISWGLQAMCLFWQCLSTLTGFIWNNLVFILPDPGWCRQPPRDIGTTAIVMILNCVIILQCWLLFVLWIVVTVCLSLFTFFVPLLRCGIHIVRCHLPFLLNQILPTRIRVLWRYWTSRFCCCPLACCSA